MKATFLGTGTSSGVPLIGCECPVCTSPDPRNRRRRASLHIQACGQCILADTPPDFREQALQWRVARVDAVLFTHAHADHVLGLDDIRRYNTIQHGFIPVYAAPETLGEVRRIFNYIEDEAEPGMYRPMLTLQAVDAPFRIGPVEVTPLPVEHDPKGKPTNGFLFRAEGRSLAYVPDCVRMPEGTRRLVTGVDVMILDALRFRPHRSHLSLDESVSLLREIGARRSFITHLGHDLDHARTQASLPANMDVPHDGLVVEW